MSSDADDAAVASAPATARGGDSGPGADALHELSQRAIARLAARSVEAGRVSARALEQHQVTAAAVVSVVARARAAAALARAAETAKPEHRERETRVAGAWIGEACRSLRGGIWLSADELVAPGDARLDEDDLRSTVLAPMVAALAESRASSDAIIELGRLALTEDTASPTAEEAAARAAAAEDGPANQLERAGEAGLLCRASSPDGSAAAAVRAVAALTGADRRVGDRAARSELVAALLDRFGSEQQRARAGRLRDGTELAALALTEPAHGSDRSHVAMRAELLDDGWALSGRKSWVSGGDAATLWLMLARPRSDLPGAGGLSLFECDALASARDNPRPGAGAACCDIVADRLPARALGPSPQPADPQLNAVVGLQRLLNAARASAVVEAALSAARRAAERVQFGVPLAHFPRVTHRLGAIRAELGAARAVLAEAAAQPDDTVATATAMLICSAAAMRTSQAATQLEGARAFEPGGAAELVRYARELALADGAAELHTAAMARALLE